MSNILDNASISQFKSSEPFELQVSRGQIENHQSVVIFGYNPDIDTSLETVWPHGGVLVSPDTALQLSVSSANSDDASGGTGARTVLVGGLDENHNAIQEIVTLNGQTAVTTEGSFLHINQCEVLTTGSLKSAAGTIYFGTGVVTDGVPATIYDVIEYDYNSRLTGSYTVPAGHTAYISQGMFSVGQQAGSNPITGRLITRNGDDVSRTAAVVTINNGSADYSFEYPIAIREKTTIEARSIGSSSNNSCTSMFVMVLIKEQQDG